MSPDQESDKMGPDANIVLVGFMGTGKSAVGRIMARRMNRTFVDMDARIENEVGKPICRIFAEDGEPDFRARERALVEMLCRERNLVVAGGGGVVLDERNIVDFDNSGRLICLQAAEDEIVRRVVRGRHRPLLEGPEDKSDLVRRLLRERKPFYDRIAYQVDTSGLSPDQVADRILRLLEDEARYASRDETAKLNGKQ